MAPTRHEKPKQNERGQSANRVLEEVPNGVAVRVHIISCRRRLLDKHDNLPASAKQLVDAICESLGTNDGDEQLSFEYSQVKSEQQGTIVLMERTMIQRIEEGSR